MSVPTTFYIANMIHELFSNYFIPHGHCYLWKPGLVGLHIASDSLISLAYFLIPLELIYIVKKRKDIPFDWIFMLFGSFIICCGITHIMEIWTLWHPTYWLSGVLKAITATVSLCTAGVVIYLIPKVLAIPSPDQLAAANLALQNEITQRKKVQEKLSMLTLELEKRVEQRTSELARTNQLLQQENHERALAQKALRESETRLRHQAQQLEDALQEVKKTQTQLIQSEKMSSLGQMVAGIAHEINNPVSFIYGNIPAIYEYMQDCLGLIQLYQKHYSQPVLEITEKIQEIDFDFIAEDVQKTLKSVKIGAERIKDIVKSLRTFSRLDEADVKEVDIHENIDSTLLILSHRLKEQPHRSAIKVIKEYGNLPPVECYAGQINQVVMNILSNAIDALVSAKKNADLVNGKTSSELLADSCPTIRIQTFFIENGLVRIHISDNGVGMSPEVLEKIYDPFYTTKPVGYGTGLGLAISYQIIKSHQGCLLCTSELGKGTEFVIVIPRSLNIEKKLISSIQHL
ncbi:MAG TPA: ATP-binding protein [Nostocaceae cyanobacterium]|nr:ATP-binding protein [Nostocaceae cyanobacterium]